MSNYTIYHCHSDLSNGVTNIDSVTKFGQYINRAKECGMNALAFSEHGSVFSWLKKKEAVEAAGMKYIHAEEFYLTESLDEKVRDNYHCVLIAKNEAGVKEINRLSSEAFRRDTNNFYYVPRLSFEQLFSTSDNVMVTTACLASVLNKGTGEAKERMLYFLTTNKDRCYLEIQHHNVDDQIAYNKLLYSLSKELGIPLIAGTDTHCLNAEHAKARAMLQHSKNVRFEDEDAWDLTFKTYDELVEAYRLQNSLPMDVVVEAIENTNAMAARVEPFEVDRTSKYPHLWGDPDGELWRKINEGIETRGIKSFPNYKEYEERIQYEFGVYKHNGAIDFILLMADIIDYCKAHDIVTGWGRGSVNGSVICWLLEITQMDSIKHGLNFERFMNTERVSLADIDTDFPPSRRDEVKEYIVNHQGLHCCDIITFNTIALRGAIRDICRGLYKDIRDDYVEVADGICDEAEANEERAREKYPDVFEYVDLVNGVIVSTGSHPCGMVVSAAPLEGDMGLCTNSNDPYPISQIYMKEIDSLNYVKLDLLALDTIETIAETCRLAGIPMLNPSTMDVQDDAVWESIREDTTNIFQWEGSIGNEYIKRLMSDKTIKSFQSVNKNVDRMTLLTIGNSAIRPAGASYRDDLANGVVRKTGSKAIDEFLADTFGFLSFQEQVIFFLHYFCGFTMGEADIVRRGFAKKTGTEQFIPRIKEGFIRTSVEKYGSTTEKAEEDIVAFLQVITDASNYLFSLNHSEPYSYEGYAEGWLRYYYPVEFITTALNNCIGKEDKTNALIAYAQKHAIPIVSPRFRHSKADYYCDRVERKIYKGIGSIRFLNTIVADELYALRDNKYETFTDLLYDLRDKTSIDSRQREILIRLNFFEEFGDMNKLVYTAYMFDKLAERKCIQRNQLEALRLTEDIMCRYADKITPFHVDEIDVERWLEDHGMNVISVTQRLIKPKGGLSTKRAVEMFEISEDEQMEYAIKVVSGRFSELHNRDLLVYLEEHCDVPKASVKDQINYQREYLGYIDYVNPELDPRIVVVTQLDTKYSPRFNAYCLKNGKSCDMKIHQKRDRRNKAIVTAWNDIPLVEGDIIYMKKCEKTPRQKKVGDQWEKVPGEWVWWINDYRLLDNITAI